MVDCLLYWFQDPFIAQLGEMDEKSLDDLLDDIPLWVKNPDYERVRFPFFLAVKLHILFRLLTTLSLSFLFLNS